MTINLIAHLQDYLPDMPLKTCWIGLRLRNVECLAAKQISANYWLFNDLCDVRSRLAENCLNPLILLRRCGKFSFSTTIWLNRKRICRAMVLPTWRFYRPLQTGLKTNGLLAVATFGKDNLKEVRQITNIGLNYPTLSQWQAWLAKDFELLWCEILR